MNKEYQECIDKLTDIGVLTEKERIELTNRALQEAVITSEQIGTAFKSILSRINNN